MDKFQRVEKPKAEAAPINENEIRITAQGRMRNYITYATTLLQVPPLVPQCYANHKHALFIIFVSSFVLFILHNTLCVCRKKKTLPLNENDYYVGVCHSFFCVNFPNCLYLLVLQVSHGSELYPQKKQKKKIEREKKKVLRFLGYGKWSAKMTFKRYLGTGSLTKKDEMNMNYFVCGNIKIDANIYDLYIQQT